MADTSMVAFYLLMAVVLSSLRRTVERRTADRRGGEGALMALVVVEVTVGVSGHGSLYPQLSPTAGAVLGEELACGRDSLRLQQAVANRTLWAHLMVDSSAHLVVGGLWGARYQLGSFDACMSAGAVSAVGARYCLASLEATRPCPRPLPPPWDHVRYMDPNGDVLDTLQGCGLVPGTLPPGEVLVAMCVPESCHHSVLQAALQATVDPTSFGVRVREEHCVARAELDDPADSPATPVFWILVVVLSVSVVAAHDLGWVAWDLKRNMAALGRADLPLAGMDLNAVSGIRAINMLLLVGVHRCFHTSRLPHADSIALTAESRSSPWHSIAHHGALLVDSCYFLSGLLLALGSGERPRPLASSFVNRYLRLTPSYAFVMLFYAAAMEAVGTGPLWKAIVVPEAAACRRWWWANLLFVNNYVHGEPGEYGCMLQSWSLAVEMHQWLLGSLLLLWLPVGRRGALLLAALVCSLLPPFLSTLLQGWPPLMIWSGRALQNPFADPLFYTMYVPSHLRAAPYIVGLIAGLGMLHLKERKVALGQAASRWLTTASLLVMVALLQSIVVFADLSQPPVRPLVAALYASLTPAVWSAALGVLVVCTTLGESTLVTGLLRWQPLVTLSRLSYSVYLVHFAVQLIQGGAARTTMHITAWTVYRCAFSDIVISLAISLWLYLALEAPVRYLAKTTILKLRSLPQIKVGNENPEKTAQANNKEHLSSPYETNVSSLFRNSPSVRGRKRSIINVETNSYLAYFSS